MKTIVRFLAKTGAAIALAAVGSASVASAQSASPAVENFGDQDPYAIYYNSVKSDGTFDRSGSLFTPAYDAAASYELASHKTTKKKASKSTSGKSGSSVWSGRWEAVVDKSDQRMRVYRNGKLIHSWKVSTGKKGYRTPTGSFRANSSRIYRHYTSKKYGSKMPYSVFFYGGYAVHATYATSRLGSTASHGCVRLSPTNASKFYKIAKAQRSSLRIRIRN